MTYTVLLVDCNPEARVEQAEFLSSAGYAVAAAATFAEALERLSDDPPDLLITDVRLGEFNGLHLVVRSRRARPRIAALVMHDVADAVLEADATRLGAAYLLKRADRADLLQTIRHVLAEQAPAIVHGEQGRRWARFHPVQPVDVIVSDRPARVVDLGLGGLGLVAGQAPSGDACGRTSLHFPAADLTVDARLVWCRGSESGDEWRCGFKLLTLEPAEAAGWRDFAVSLMSAI